MAPTWTPRPWQRRFLACAMASGVRTSVLSLPRGQGKSSLAARLAWRFLTPGDPLHVPGAESHIAAASIGQARRTTWRLLREMLPAGREYRIAESRTECSALHVASGARVSVLASSAKTAQGLVRCPLLIADEPASWETAGGESMHDAIQTAQGKPGCSLRAIYIGVCGFAGWWPDLVHAGSGGPVHVTVLQGDPELWDQAPEIRRCNPLMWTFADSRAVLLEERDAARLDPAAKARFLTLRLNLPSANESTVMVTVSEWGEVCARPVAERAGRPVVGVVLSGGRGWSAAVALWPGGRVEALALAPGVPALDAQERRDRQPRAAYAGLGLVLDADRRIPRTARLVELMSGAGWRPAVLVVADARRRELLDVRPGVPVEGRQGRAVDAGADVRELRRLVLDGGVSVAPAARPLLAASIGAARVVTDGAGQSRLQHDANRGRRFEVAAAWLLACGAASRRPVVKPLRWSAA